MKNILHVLRAERRLSQDDLAKLVEVSRQTINAIEREKYDPSLPLALKIAKVFDRKVEEIFFLDNNSSTSQTKI
jgi:putative transcriptional regulator